MLNLYYFKIYFVIYFINASAAFLTKDDESYTLPIINGSIVNYIFDGIKF